MCNQSVAKKCVSFNQIEEEIFRIVCGVGLEWMKEILEGIDNQIMEARDKEVYSNHGFRASHIETKMGRVNFERRQYVYKDEDDRKCYVFLLDKELELSQIGKISSALIEMIVKQVTTESFRNSANSVSEMTGIDISHGTAWSVTQKLGEKIEEDEKNKIALFNAEKSIGEKEVPVLFEEADGVYIKIQGKDRKANGKSREMKVGVTYEGWEKEGEKRFKLVNKRAICTLGDSKKFKELKESTVASEYNVDEIKFRIQNGDGAAWIHDNNDDTMISQLDPFHIKQALRKKIPDDGVVAKIETMIDKRQIDEAIEFIDAMANSILDDKQEVKLRELYTYYSSNRETMLPYRDRGINLPQLGNGLVYRNMGTMEHHICDIIALRMKRRKGSWSIKGATNIGKILAVKVSGNLHEIIRTKLMPQIPEKYETIVNEVLSAGKVPAVYGKGSDGNIRHGGMPFVGMPVTNGRKAIQNMLKYWNI